MTLDALGPNNRRVAQTRKARKHTWLEEQNILFFSNHHAIAIIVDEGNLHWACPKCRTPRFEHEDVDFLECPNCVILLIIQPNTRYRPCVYLTFDESSSLYHDQMWGCPVCNKVLGHNGSVPPESVTCGHCRSAWQKHSTDGNPNSAYYVFAMTKTDLLFNPL